MRPSPSDPKNLIFAGREQPDTFYSSLSPKSHYSRTSSRDEPVTFYSNSPVHSPTSQSQRSFVSSRNIPRASARTSARLVNPQPGKLFSPTSHSFGDSGSKNRTERSARRFFPTPPRDRTEQSKTTPPRSLFSTPSKDKTERSSTPSWDRSRTDRSYHSDPIKSRIAAKTGQPGSAFDQRTADSIFRSERKSSSRATQSFEREDDRRDDREEREEQGASKERRGNMVDPSSFWDQAASVLNEFSSPTKKPPPPPPPPPHSAMGGPGSAQRRGAYESAREGGSETRENVDTSNMPSVTSDSPTTLYTLIKSRNWREVLVHCKMDKSEAGTWVVERNANGTVRWRLLPLHQACEMQPPEEVVKALIVAYPPAVDMKDSGGDLPLHLACRERATKEVIHTLLLADPDTAKITDDEGRLPLHLACRQGAGIEIVDNLLVTYHRGAKTADSYGLLPLHWACAQNATVPIVESLLRANPYAVDVKDKWGRTPLSLAHASTNTDKERIVAALGRDASYWTTSLKTEVEDLRGRLETTSLRAQQEGQKAYSLESKLAEVMAASSEAAMSFQQLRGELEDENAKLREEVDDLKPRIVKSDERIRYLEDKNARLRDQVGVLAERLGHLTNVFRAMEEQRLQILRVTGEWEDSLQKAAELVLIDGDEEDGSVLTSNT